MQSALYGQLHRTRALRPDDVDRVGRTYVEMALSGQCTEAQRAYFVDEGRAMVDAGADAVVLAGTDLGLAFDGRDVGYRVIDALDVHIGVLVDLACGRIAL